MDIGFDSPHRHAKRRSNLLIAHLLEMKERERHALVIGKPVERTRHVVPPVLEFDIHCRRMGRDERELVSGSGIPTVAPAQLAEEPPTRAVSRQVVEAGISRHRLEPAGSRRACADLIETLKCPQKYDLRHILGLDRGPQQSYGGRVHHVLIPPHEHFKRVRVGHAWGVARWPSLKRKTRRRGESFKMTSDTELAAILDRFG